MTALALKTAECHVWWADPREHPIESLIGVLSPSELKRAASYRREPDRLRNLTASWLLRTAAAELLDVPAGDIPVERRCPDCDKPHGRPYILTSDGLHASISHSGSRVAVALTTAGPVGVDVEEVPTAPLSELVRCALTPRETALLETLPERDRHAAFARMWVCKEGVLKATGHGLRIPPNKVEVAAPWLDPALLAWPLDLSPEEVRISDLRPGPGYAGVVAILTDAPAVKVSEWDASGLGRFSFPSAVPMAA
ncbi:4'-phosphopantetheinyl transferase family protein [Sphaerisporangium fuscum]|uniref:4'-phosphopantetheinyl transferase family protein n=1 Tax=Sphaerisporangium fuscum TaxID=2835868 RepID=UPI001BDCF70A|nr:4'-phosphopantetheinyl transferase superfamily protein [Sphaerisporangium fuscum]